MSGNTRTTDWQSFAAVVVFTTAAFAGIVLEVNAALGDLEPCTWVKEFAAGWACILAALVSGIVACRKEKA